MNRLQNYLFVLAIMFFALTIPSKAQITIGSDNKPAKAALLQLKQWETEDNISPGDMSNSEKGFGLPRVKLVNRTTLEPFMAANTPPDALMEHQGLMVYNLTEDAAQGFEKGIYVWMGKAFWERLESIESVSLSQTITPSTKLEFPSGLTTQSLVAQNLTIEWTPIQIPTQLGLIATENGGIGWTLPSSSTGTTGTYSLSIKPTAFTPKEVALNPFLEKISVLTATSQELGGANQLNQNVELRQIHYAFLIKGFSPYMDQDRSYPINIKTNADWELTIDDPNSIMDSGITDLPLSGNANVEGLTYTFRLKSDVSLEGKSLKLTFSSPTGKFADQEYTIYAIQKNKYHNSYIVAPGGSVNIPVRRVYAAWANDLDTKLTGAITAELVWQDQHNLVKPTIKVIGAGETASIQVETNNITGNAVVAMKIGAEICWSWHLWVMSYNPNQVPPATIANTTPGVAAVDSVTVAGGKVYTRFNGYMTSVFMDRSLGATSDDPTSPNINGFFFQWGRKDPFAPANANRTGMSSITSIFAGRPIYDINNVQLPVEDTGMKTATVTTTDAPNLKNAIQNPMTLYIGVYTNDQDWYSARIGEHKTDLWYPFDEAKGVYDPCPAGWRVPIIKANIGSPYYQVITPNKFVGTSYTIDLRNQGIGFFQAGGGVTINPATNQARLTAVGGAYFHGVSGDSEFLTAGGNMGSSSIRVWRLLSRGVIDRYVRCVKDM